MIRKSIFIFFIFILPLFTSIISAQEAQWRGPERDGIYPDKGLLQEWPENGPSLFLKKEGLASGWTTPVMVENIIYISGRRDSLEVLTALTLQGEVIWETPFGKSWQSSFPDSRNSPTIEGDRIYITAAMGTVSCIDRTSGDIIWSVNTHDVYKGKFHRWGFAESLVLSGNAVISSPIGEETVMVALNKDNGELIWKTDSLGDERAYASPMIINHNGNNIILAETSVHIVGIDPSDGTLLWKYDLVKNLTEKNRRNNTNTPLYSKGEIFITSGYDAQSVMLTLADDGKSVSLKWTNDVLDTHHGGVVLVDGNIYGANWINNGNGNWVCLNWDTGETLYEEKWYNKGSIVYADNRLYIYEEKQGHVGLLKPNPEKFDLVGSFKIEDGNGPHWAHPAIYDGYLLMRHGEVLLVYDVKKER